MGFVLQGAISFMPLPDILQWLEMNRKTGLLTVTINGVDRMIYFESGKIVFVSSSEEGHRFGEFLTGLGYLDGGTVASALADSARSGVCFTQYLIGKSYLTADVLTRVLTELAMKILADSVASESGSFSFSSHIPRAVRGGPIRLPTGAIILDSLRKMDEKRRGG